MKQAEEIERQLSEHKLKDATWDTITNEVADLMRKAFGKLSEEKTFAVLLECMEIRIRAN